MSRLERERALDLDQAGEALKRLAALSASWEEIEAGAAIRATGRRLLRVHPLAAADALQLAAAIVAAEGRPSTLPFVTLDDRLADAVRREGFTVAEPPSAPEQP